MKTGGASGGLLRLLQDACCRVAVVTFVEESRSRRNEQIVDFKGRTVMVLEFSPDGLIHHMRRYLD